jgi:hypothetical protein
MDYSFRFTIGVDYKAKSRFSLEKRLFCKKTQNLFAGFIFALLIGHPAGGLAGRLAGGLAFPAAAVLRALLQIAGFNRMDSFHACYTPISILRIKFHMP